MQYSRIDKDKTPELLKILSSLSNKVIEIGIFGDAKEEVLIKAKVNEYGASITITEEMRNFFAEHDIYIKKSTKKIDIPERPFIRGSFDSFIGEVYKFIEIQIELLFEFKITVMGLCEELGKFCEKLIKTYMQDLQNPPNSPITLILENKASSNPLIHTSELKNSISYRVV